MKSTLSLILIEGDQDKCIQEKVWIKLAFKPGQRLFRASSYFTSLDKDNRINLQQIDLLKGFN